MEDQGEEEGIEEAWNKIKEKRRDSAGEDIDSRTVRSNNTNSANAWFADEIQTLKIEK